MICPKCGFDQPDDAYCAFCGVNIERYQRQRRKKLHVAYLLIATVCIAGFAVAKYIKSVDRIEAPELTTKYSKERGEVQVKNAALPGAKPPRRESPGKPRAQSRIDHHRRSESQDASFRTEGREAKGLGGDEPSLKPSLVLQQESDDTVQGQTHTAAEWFEKGRRLDDESESEVEFYKKALELDHEFAPAYYRLGAIYYRQANYELADQEFAKFLKYASEADRHAYDIYVYYSPSDMERLLAADVVERASAEGVDKETPVEAKEAGKESPAAVKETEQEITVEVEEVEQETPVEAEEAEREAPAETEEALKETPAEVEEAEQETPVEAEEEIEESVSEEAAIEAE